MIQRIQTLYLIGTVIAGIIFFIVPAAASSAEVYTGADLPYAVILESLTVAVALVTVFLYKKQTLQLRFSGFNIVMQLGMPFLVWACMHGTEWSIRFGMAMPLIQIILTWLAMRGIFKDFLTLKSLDRLR